MNNEPFSLSTNFGLAPHLVADGSIVVVILDIARICIILLGEIVERVR